MRQSEKREMITTPLISVIIPVYNGAEFLPAALASVRAQAYTPLELIVVDDGSTDQTAQVVQRLGDDIHYLYQQNQGPAAARNTGIAAAQGELITFLDADDLWPADKLAQQVAALAAAPGAALSWGYTQISVYDEAPRALPPLAPSWYPLLGSILCRRAVFQQIGGFEASLRYAEDVDWFMRIREEQIMVEKSPGIVLFYRLRRGSMTDGKPMQELGVVECIRRAVQRRRQREGRETI